MNPDTFLQLLQDKFIPALSKRLESDPRDGRILYMGPSTSLDGIDVQIEDKHGRVSTFYINPMTQSFSVVYEAR